MSDVNTLFIIPVELGETRNRFNNIMVDIRAIGWILRKPNCQETSSSGIEFESNDIISTRGTTKKKPIDFLNVFYREPPNGSITLSNGLDEVVISLSINFNGFCVGCQRFSE